MKRVGRTGGDPSRTTLRQLEHEVGWTVFPHSEAAPDSERRRSHVVTAKQCTRGQKGSPGQGVRARRPVSFPRTFPPAMNLRVRQIGTLCVLALALTQAAFRFQDDEKTPLGKKMAAINTAFKAVGRQIDDPSKNAATLKQLDIIETNAKEAMALDPEKKAQVPAAQQAKFVADYKAGMKVFIETVGKMRTAVKAGNNAEASKLIDAMKDQQRDSHKEFRIRKAGAPPGL